MYLATKYKTSLLIDLAHLDEERWTGGKYRSLQTYEIFEDAGFTLTKLEEPARPSKISMLLWAIKGIIKFGIYRPLCLTSLRITGYGYFRWSYYCQQYPEVSTVLFEGTGFGVLQSVAFIKSFGRRVLLAPINVESLAPYPEAWTHQLPILNRLKEELKYYRMADYVFCISLEETWLLSILECKTFFLPYFPPRKLLDKIKIRRDKRIDRIKEGLLYYANFENSPNYLGFKKFVEEKGYIDRKIKVAGFGIHRVLPLIGDIEEFIVVGELNEVDMEEALLTCEKVIFNHFPTSGTLTRVPELLLSGIPIEGNIAAMKGYLMIPEMCLEGAIKHLEELTKNANLKLLKEIEQA